MMEFVNEVLVMVTRLIVAAAGGAFIYIGIPYMKKLGVYKIVQLVVRAAEKLGSTNQIPKETKKEWVVKMLEHFGVKTNDVIDAMIEAAVEEIDLQNKKIAEEVKKDE